MVKIKTFQLQPIFLPKFRVAQKLRWQYDLINKLLKIHVVSQEIYKMWNYYDFTPLKDNESVFITWYGSYIFHGKIRHKRKRLFCHEIISMEDGESEFKSHAKLNDHCHYK